MRQPLVTHSLILKYAPEELEFSLQGSQIFLVLVGSE